MQFVLVSGLSGSGKSIALDVLEENGYYCVVNLPATLLLDVVQFLDEGGHQRAAVSVDARSAALSALPGHLATLREAFLQAATHAPHPMHDAASMDRSATACGTGVVLASGALPTFTDV